MFFVLAKVLGFFTYPSTFFTCLGVLGLLLWPTRLARFGRIVSGFAAVALLVFGLTPLGEALILPLEQRFPAQDPGAMAPPAGIIVLGGAVNVHVAALRERPALNEAGERLTAIAELARRFPQAKIVFSGGDGNLSGAIWGAAPESTVARRLFASFGIAEDRLVFETKSRDTFENAMFSRDLLQPKPGERWLLVTSAWHMPRSVLLFRKAGFDVVPYPTDYRTGGWSDLTSPFYSVAEGLRLSDIAVREWVGLIVYRLSGRTDTILPTP